MSSDLIHSESEYGELGEAGGGQPVRDDGPLGKRRAGLLVPVFAMRHREDFGIGDTRAVREAIDFCAENGFGVLQMLPIHETFGDHSPYNPISSRALSPAYVDISPEEVPGLTASDMERAAPEAWLAQLRSGIVKHGSVHPLKIQILQRAAHRFFTGEDEKLAAEFTAFIAREQSWLDHYTLFRLLVREYEGNTQWLDWRPEHQSWQSACDWLLQHPDREELEEVRDGYAYAQWIACRQWDAVRIHAESKKVMLMGEMSFGVGPGSCDVWANPELFDLDWSMGTPPLGHFDTSKDAERWGQNWGFPPYRWENHRAQGFSWLRARVEGEGRFFHICRIDHLRGYFRAYMFPWPGGARHSEYSNLTEEEAAMKAGGKLPRFIPGPDDDPVAAQLNEFQGREIITVIREAAGTMELVAELMGEMPEYMSRALQELPLANLVFPQLEILSDNPHPETLRLRELALISYGNHDNAPLATTYMRLQRAAEEFPDGREARELRWMLQFAGWTGPPPTELDEDLLNSFQEALLKTPCKLAVFMWGDLLGTALRFNLPGSYGIETWCERMDHSFSEYGAHAVYGSRISTVRRLIVESGRAERR